MGKSGYIYNDNGEMWCFQMIFRTFIGEAKTAIDEKGRTAFPREFRRQLAEDEKENLVVTRGPEGSLRVYVYAEFEKFMQELDNRRDPRQAERVRSQLSMALLALDGQNRILLPKNLLEKAGLKSEVLWVPSRGKTLALWNPQTFAARFDLNSDESRAEFDAAFYGESLNGGDNVG